MTDNSPTCGLLPAGNLAADVSADASAALSPITKTITDVIRKRSLPYARFGRRIFTPDWSALDAALADIVNDTNDRICAKCGGTNSKSNYENQFGHGVISSDEPSCSDQGTKSS